MPNRRKPNALHLVAGTLRPDRHGGADPIPNGPIGKAPDYLSRAQSEIWERLVESSAPGLLTASDRPALARLCVLYGAAIDFTRELNQSAAMIDSADHRRPQRIKNPALRELLRIEEAIRRLEVSFGFDPYSRARITLPADPLGVYGVIS